MINLRFEEINGHENSAHQNFESLCALLVYRENPLAKAIDGKGGDEGIDIFIGAIGDENHIFQAKYFCDSLKKPQKDQIIKSLDVAVKKHSPKRWTLCIPKDFTIAEERWFESLKRDYPQCSIDYWNATALRSKLLENPDILYVFFPSANELKDFEIISEAFWKSMKMDSQSDSAFFDGTRPTWLDIASNKDIRRDLTDIVLPKLLEDMQGMYLLELTATGGSGKSTFLMRLAYELSCEKKIVLFHRRDKNVLDAQSILNFARRLDTYRVFVIIDDAVRLSNLDEFVSYLSDFSPKITLIMASRAFERQAIRTNSSPNLKLLNLPKQALNSLSDLSDIEIHSLINKLASMGKIRQPTENEMHDVVQHYAEWSNRSILALVFILLKGERIADVIRDELGRLQRISPSLYIVYRYICLLNAMRSFATKKMIKALVGSELTYELLNPLSGLVEDQGNKLFTRHDRIADIAIKIMFEHDQQGLLDIASKALTIAVELEEWEVVEQIRIVDDVSSDLYTDWVVLIFDAKLKLTDPKFAFEFFTNLVFRFPDEEMLSDTLKFVCGARFQEIIDLLHRGRSRTAQIQRIEVNNEILEIGMHIKSISRDVTNYSRSDEEFYNLIYIFRWVFAIGHYRDAISPIDLLFQTLLWLHPNDSMIHYEYGFFLIETGYEEEAIEFLQKAVSFREDFLNAYVILFVAAYVTRNWELAKSAIDEAISINPSQVINADTEIFDGYIMEFLSLSARIEDWVILNAYNMLRQLDISKNLERIVNKEKTLQLSVDNNDFEIIDEISSKNKISLESINSFFAFGVWLRSQPLEIKRKYAQSVWHNKPHNLPGDSINYD